MIYLTGATSNRDEPLFIAAGVGLIVTPRSSYEKRIPRYAYWAADNGCFSLTTYVGDDKWLEWLDRLPRDGCLFAVVPDVARRPDGSLGGDPEATWEKFLEFGPVVQEMGFPAALAAQNGIESMPNLREQIEACDCLFLAGNDEWKLGPSAALVARLARNAGKWVHMGRVNSMKRMKWARAIGCQSADGTFVKYARRRRTSDANPDDDRLDRGVDGVSGWTKFLAENPPLPLARFDAPSHPTQRAAHIATDTHR